LFLFLILSLCPLPFLFLSLFPILSLLPLPVRLLLQLLRFFQLQLLLSSFSRHR
jgi:hypothetical protein